MNDLAKIVQAVICGFFVLLTSGIAKAVQYGELRIHSNTTLTDDRYGDVVFTAGNITLDCANHQVHISSFTKTNGGSKAAIYSDGNNGISVRNCRVVGGFDESLSIQNSSNVTIQNVTASTSAVFFGNTGVVATGLNLRADVGMFVASDTAGSYSASVACSSQGIEVTYSTSTKIFNTSISGCSDAAVFGESNDGLFVDTVDLENNVKGLTIGSDSNDIVQNSTFNNNTTTGIASGERQAAVCKTTPPSEMAAATRSRIRHPRMTRGPAIPSERLAACLNFRRQPILTAQCSTCLARRA